MKRLWMAASFGALLLLAHPSLAIEIQEIRIDQPSGDTDEYFELSGSPGESLAGMTYIVIGDNSIGGGVIESILDLSSYSLNAMGLFTVAEATASFTPDLTSSLNFENSDNVTHMLVRDFSGADGDDLDTDDDGSLESTPWSEIIDSVALIESEGSGDHVYSPNSVGPDNGFVPGHIYMCAGTWLMGGFDFGTDDTPTEVNGCTVAIEENAWSSVKSLYR